MKTNLSISLRWRIAIVLLLLLWGVGGFAQVSVTNLATNYAAKQISFTVSWTAAPYNNQIWVITDYVKVENATTVGGWSRALVTGATATGNGSAATVTGQRGFWLNTSGSSGSATITATLSGVPAQFNWCAYALNYPPRAVINAAGGYDLKGTPPFTVNGTTLGNTVTTYGAGTCITTLSDATNNPTSVLPDAPTVSTSNPAARCGAGAVTLTATAGGGTTTAMTYTWVVGGGAAQTTTTGSLSLSSVAEGSTTYSVTVTNANGCTSAAKTGTITVHGLPAITLASGSTMQTVNAGSAITQIKYTTANATSATPSNLPTGISSAWSSNVYTISGTPTSVGTYNYSVATTNSNGCTNVSATGKITVNPTPITYTYCTPPTLVLTGVGFANSTTYTRNGITLSAPVTVTTCQKETYAGGSSGAYKADCRTNPSYAGDLFSWCMVVQHAVQLCPTPWRVPTHNDFCKYAGFADECTSETSSIYDGIDGWLLGGYSSNGGKLYFDGLYGYYWSSTEYSAELSTNANVYGDRFLPIYHFEKYYGFSLRCVR